MGIIYTLDEVMRHLDEQVRLIEEFNASCHLTNHIYAEKLPKEIYYPEGLEQMADVLGIKVKCEKHAMGGDKRYFMYKGYCIYQWGGEEDE